MSMQAFLGFLRRFAFISVSGMKLSLLVWTSASKVVILTEANTALYNHCCGGAMTVGAVREEEELVGTVREEVEEEEVIGLSDMYCLKCVCMCYVQCYMYVWVVLWLVPADPPFFFYILECSH